MYVRDNSGFVFALAVVALKIGTLRLPQCRIDVQVIYRCWFSCIRLYSVDEMGR
jgi:hypothetical protein